ncbi:MAG: hypothetical protein WCT77_02920 [Bacteroidota bacterium]
MDDGTKLFVTIIFWILACIFFPMIAIWSINTLFGTALVGEFLSLHWWAMFLLLIILRKL